MVSYRPSLEELRRAVEGELAAFLAERRAALPQARPLIREVSRLIEAGGKRIRPSLCYWSYRAAGGQHQRMAVRAASSLELLHTFAIVHDDIMDAAEERRGVPTVHSIHGVEVALLTGDLALALADDLFMTSGFSATVALRAFRWYSKMRQEVIAGQFLDHEASGDAFVDESRARMIAVLKSGRYTVEEPLAIGASLAGADTQRVSALRDFGAPLGEAFQLRDDLLGTFGDPSSTGKPVDSDIREGKRNVLYAKAVAALDGADKEFFASHWGRGAELDAYEVERLRKLVESSGARRETEALLARLRDSALQALDRLELDPQGRAALEHLARLSTDRRA